jgi:ribosomal protein L30
MAKLRITYTKSAIGYSVDQKATVASLGLRKLHSTVIHEDTPAVRGMAFKVRHLVTVTEVADEAAPAKAPKATPAARATLVPEQGTTAAAEPVAVRAKKTPKPEDLEAIEGIGPKIAGILREAGIHTFAQLAATEVSTLSEILQKANLRLADPTTWPEQAQLAADGKWDEFKTLQDNLNAGRRS